jgi:hypothetical protein
MAFASSTTAPAASYACSSWQPRRVAVVTAVLIALGRRSPGRVSDASGESPRIAAAPTVPAAPGRLRRRRRPPPSRATRPWMRRPSRLVRAVDRLRARRRAEAAAQAGTPPELDARDVIEYLRSRGERTGIAAFEPPGTDPPKSGIIVPDDFPLPEGYVRTINPMTMGIRCRRS